jgi:hypothetical protein
MSLLTSFKAHSTSKFITVTTRRRAGTFSLLGCTLWTWLLQSRIQTRLEKTESIFYLTKNTQSECLFKFREVVVRRTHPASCATKRHPAGRIRTCATTFGSRERSVERRSQTLRLRLWLAATKKKKGGKLMRCGFLALGGL